MNSLLHFTFKQLSLDIFNIKKNCSLSASYAINVITQVFPETLIH